MGETVHVIAWPCDEAVVIIDCNGTLKESSYTEVGIKISNRIYLLPVRIFDPGETRKHVAQYMKRLKKRGNLYEVYFSRNVHCFTKLKSAFKFAKTQAKKHLKFSILKTSNNIFEDDCKLIEYSNGEVFIGRHPNVSKQTLTRFVKELTKLGYNQ